MPALFAAKDQPTAQAIAALAKTNPFLAERVAAEAEVLGATYTPTHAVWNVDHATSGANPNLVRIQQQAERLADLARRQLVKGAPLDDDTRPLYEELVLYVLHSRYDEAFYRVIVAQHGGDQRRPRFSFYRQFAHDVKHFFGVPACQMMTHIAPEQLFALLFQIRRAFHFIFRYIFGGSEAAATLRAAVWQSIFTVDIQRYRRLLTGRMQDLATLIVGPTGTGKELVASAIAFARFIPFDAASETFRNAFPETFQPLNLAALSPTLIESELFGHRRGAFTGAVADRSGFLDQDSPVHTVFLDEIGELDPGLQVKLLRVLQTREFSRLGDSAARRYGGKIVAATNQDLSALIHAGRFRADLYYRLCSDVIRTPPLRAQLADDRQELENLVGLIARGLVGPGDDADALTGEVVAWVNQALGAHYPWPGNMRELGQAVRSVLVRGQYRPLAPVDVGSAASPADQFAAELLTTRLSAKEVERKYCALAYAREGTFLGVARRLHIDRRTVKRTVDWDFYRALDQAGETRAVDSNEDR